ncbi:MAG: hypothetical protein NT145_08185 [Elusimicrobia bacterium]|nr:hypothetical protein [Elusimicrobiota bacterium]
MNIRFNPCALFVITALFIGCASPSKFVKGFLGISVENLRNQKEGRFSTALEIPYNECYAKALLVLKDMKVEVFVEDKKNRCIGASKFDGVFPYCLSATEVGVFFEYKDELSTRIDVVSKNHRLAEFVLDKIQSKFNAKAG